LKITIQEVVCETIILTKLGGPPRVRNPQNETFKLLNIKS